MPQVNGGKNHRWQISNKKETEPLTTSLLNLASSEQKFRTGIFLKTSKSFIDYQKKKQKKTEAS